jgi:hypothetical protein
MLRHVVIIGATHEIDSMQERIASAGRTKVGAMSTVLVIDDDPFSTERMEGAQTTLALRDTVVSAEVRQRLATAMGLSVEEGRPRVARGIAPPSCPTRRSLWWTSRGTARTASS